MSAYYFGPGCWLFSDHYKAAHNHIILAPTRRLLAPETVAAAQPRVYSYLHQLNLTGVELPRSVMDCFLAQALAEDDIYPRILRPDGSMKIMCWYRISDIPKACAKITADDLAKAFGWLAHEAER